MDPSERRGRRCVEFAARSLDIRRGKQGRKASRVRSTWLGWSFPPHQQVQASSPCSWRHAVAGFQTTSNAPRVVPRSSRHFQPLQCNEARWKPAGDAPSARQHQKTVKRPQSIRSLPLVCTRGPSRTCRRSSVQLSLRSSSLCFPLEFGSASDRNVDPRPWPSCRKSPRVGRGIDFDPRTNAHVSRLRRGKKGTRIEVDVRRRKEEDVAEEEEPKDAGRRRRAWRKDLETTPRDGPEGAFARHVHASQAYRNTCNKVEECEWIWNHGSCSGSAAHVHVSVPGWTGNTA